MLKIAVVGPQPERAAVIEEVQRDAGYRDIHRLSKMTKLLERLSALAPDVILVAVSRPDEKIERLDLGEPAQRPNIDHAQPVLIGVGRVFQAVRGEARLTPVQEQAFHSVPRPFDALAF